MIVPMKKASIVVQQKDASKAATTLRKLGVLHLEHHRTPEGRDISEIREDIKFVNKSISIFSSSELDKKPFIQRNEYIDNWKKSVRHIAHLWARLDQIKEYNSHLAAQVEEWTKWGNFEPQDIKTLSEEGVFIRLYAIPKREVVNLPDHIVVKKIFTEAGQIYCALVSTKEIDIGFKEMKLPEMSLERLKEKIIEGEGVTRSIQEELFKISSYKDVFLRIKKALRKELEYHEALRGMGQSESLVYQSGYVPYDAAENLIKTARNEQWGIVISDPKEGDVVPTFIRNPKWISLIEPVFKMLELIPGYKELDISLWFLLFFSVFFGMIIGDAGYGAVFFIITLVVSRKSKGSSEMRPMFILLYILSSCAIVWGVLTGTFFGQEWLSPFIKPLIPALRDNKNLQTLCFFIGALHLSVAHIWRAVVKMPSIKALADFGWTSIIWGVFFLANTLILGDKFPHFGSWFFITGITLVIFFTNPSLNILKGIASGVGSLLLNIVNSFTDVVSYIRLFAVGLATVAIADAFNAMALDIGFNSIASGIATSFILFLGHALNIVLGPLSILVHGLRLNILEFCSHLDISWSGFQYRPFRK